MASKIDDELVDRAVLALLWSNASTDKYGTRAWKSLPWDAMNRLHARGLISDPVGTAKSVAISADAVTLGKQLFNALFSREAPASVPTMPPVEIDDATVLQFMITLMDIAPPIWRRIQLPLDATFWDLHVAIADAFGWKDKHLHAFAFGARGRERSKVPPIGIVLPDMPNDLGTLPGWEIKLRDRFNEAHAICRYVYDFGDNWEHEVRFEGEFPRDRRTSYPYLVSGARACPPEDCGGVPGYLHLCEVMAKGRGVEFEDLKASLGGRFSPERFSRKAVSFDDAESRLDDLLESRSLGVSVAAE